MNIEQLRYLVSSSSNPVVVEINDDLVNLEGKVYENGVTCYGNFSPGMGAEIISISAEEVFENDPHASLYKVTLSVEKFFEHNCIVDRGYLYKKTTEHANGMNYLVTLKITLKPSTQVVS